MSNPNIKTKSLSSNNKAVRERLLDAAEELFCEKGFDGTSVRDLAAAADCNLASVNYYFGGKENLYTEVWRRHLKDMSETRLRSIEEVMSSKPSLENLLRSFANAFMKPLLDERKGGSLMKLMSREMLDHRLSVDMFHDEVIAPTMTAMQDALIQVCPNLDKSKVPFVIFSVVGQLVHIIHFKSMFDQSDKEKMPQFDMSDAIDHIVEFSAAAIRAFAEGKAE